MNTLNYGRKLKEHEKGSDSGKLKGKKQLEGFRLDIRAVPVKEDGDDYRKWTHLDLFVLRFLDKDVRS